MMYGVGALIFDKGKVEGLQKFVAVIQRYMKKHGVDAETACEELEEDYEEYKDACRLISTEE